MEAEVAAFVSALKKASRAADNTVDSYRRDLLSFRRFLIERRRALEFAKGHASASDAPDDGDLQDDIDIATINADHIRDYLADLMKTAKRATVQRRLSAIKAFFRYRETATGAPSPARTLRSPKSERRLPAILEQDEVRRLIRPILARNIPPPRRFATARLSRRCTPPGLRVSELVGLNWRMLTKTSGW